MQNYIAIHFSQTNNIFADTIEYKKIYYSAYNHHSVVLHNEEGTDFEMGIIRKIMINHNGKDKEKITIIYQRTVKDKIDKLGIYKVSTSDEFNHICITKLAHYYPIYLYCKQKSGKLPELYLTLRTSPLLT